MGDFTLDFTGEFDYEAEAQISVGMGSIEIILPSELAVRLETEENWFNSIDIPRSRFHKVRGRDGIWETENWDKAGGRLTLILDIGMGSADIRFR
jgi:predicted membrane protein